MKKILDELFLGFWFIFPKFAVYLVVPTIILCVLHAFNIIHLTDQSFKIITFSLAPISLFGLGWLIYRNYKK